MPTMNQKNVPLLAAGQDLGIQDAINQQMQDRLDEDKKRKLLMGSSPAAAALGLGSMSAGSGM
jgi:hypothetical protein